MKVSYYEFSRNAFRFQATNTYLIANKKKVLTPSDHFELFIEENCSVLYFAKRKNATNSKMSSLVLTFISHRKFLVASENFHSTAWVNILQKKIYASNKKFFNVIDMCVQSKEWWNNHLNHYIQMDQIKEHEHPVYRIFFGISVLLPARARINIKVMKIGRFHTFSSSNRIASSYSWIPPAFAKSSFAIGKRQKQIYFRSILRH